MRGGISRLSLRLQSHDGPAARQTVMRYLMASAVGNLVWETLQLPLYTLWQTAHAVYLGFAVLHCWVGDLLIASISLGCGIVVAGRSWPLRGYGRATAVALILGVAYTVFSEWFHVTVHTNWTYAPAMPRVPPLGTGLSPLLQWIVVPLAAFAWARPRRGPRPGSR